MPYKLTKKYRKNNRRSKYKGGENELTSFEKAELSRKIQQNKDLEVSRNSKIDWQTRENNANLYTYGICFF